MAELAGLYLGMGIDTSQLNSDFMNAEKTINQNLKRINQEMEMIQLRGQMEIDGLDETASQTEKVRIQEEALSKQMELQQDKILLLTKAHEHLIKTRGENAEVTRQVELQLNREQHAMDELKTKTEDLSKQTEIALAANWEMLALIEPVLKKIESMAAAGTALPFGLTPPQAKIAAGTFIALTSVIAGTAEATEELREANPAQLVDEDLQRLSGSIDNSWQKINESNRRGMEQMRSYNREYYRNNYYDRQNQYYNNRQNQYYHNAAKAQDEQIKATRERTEQIKEIKEQTEQIGEIKKEQAGILERFAKAVGVQEDQEGNLKISPDPNRNDILRVAKIFEDYRFSESLSAALDLWKESNSVVGKLAATLTTVYFLAQKAQQPIAEFAQSSIENFRELSKAASELNLSLDRTNDLRAKINLAGGDYDDVRDYVRGVQDAVIKGDSEDPEVIAIEKYGVAIQDANGKLLDFDETLDRLYQGYLKAREAGEAEAYIIMTNGQAVQDVLPYFEGLAQAEEDMAKIKWSTLDPATLKNASREMKLFETQTQELANAVSSVLAPAAEMAFRNMFEDQKALTEVIENNREEIIYWSFVFMEAINVVRDFKKELEGDFADGFTEILETAKSFHDTLKEFFVDEPTKDIGEEAKERFIPFYTELKKINNEFDLIGKLQGFLPEGFTEEIDNAINSYLVPLHQELKSIEDEFDIISKLKNAVSDFLPTDLFSGEDSIFARAQKDLEDYKKENEEARKETEKTKDYLDGLSYSLNRIKKYKNELANLELDLRFSGDGFDYQKALEKNKVWYEDALKDARQYEEEKAVLAELNAAKIKQIEQEREEKLKEIRQRVSEADMTELEKRLIAIEDEKDKWIKAGMEKAEAEILAEKQKADFIKNIEQELSAEIEAVNQNDLQRKLSQIEKEKQAWIKKGAEEARVEELAQAKRLKAYQETEQKLNEIRNSVLLADRSDLEKRLADIDKEKEAWIQLGMEKAEAEELAQKKREQIIKEANEKVAEDTEKAVEEAARKTEESFERAEQKNEALRNSALNVLKQEAKEFEVFMTEGYNGLQKLLYDQLIKSGVNPEYLKKMTPELLSDYQNATKKAMRSFLPNWEDPYTGKVYKPKMPEELEELKGVSEKVSIFSSATSAATGALYNLAEAANYAIVDGKKTTMSEALGTNYAIVDGVKTTMSEALGKLPTATENVTQSFSAMPPATKAATDALGTLPTAVQGATENLSELTMPQYDIPQFATPQLETLNNPFADMTQDLQVTIQRFTEMNSGVEAVTVKLNDLSAVLANLSLQSPNQQTPTETRTPVEVNTTVQIDEAHAWDMNHIQELADKVADIIKPEIISAIGGDSNSY